MLESDSFEIKSNKSDLRLIISDVKGESFKATVESGRLRATRGVYSYTDSHGLANLLEKLSLQEKPWDGEEGWEGIEGEFKLFASCTSLGAVVFRVELRDYNGGEDWTVETELMSEMGQLIEIARSARRVFGRSPY